jgi:hypothetical protein
MKDVVLVKGFRKIAVAFTPAMEGLTLFHCHQQLHMDYGFKMLFEAASGGAACTNYLSAIFALEQIANRS